MTEVVSSRENYFLLKILSIVCVFLNGGSQMWKIRGNYRDIL